MFYVAGVAQLVEQLICNQQVIRSNRIIGSKDEKTVSGRYQSGQMERTVDPLAERLRRFESFPPHHFARVAQSVERILGKDEVTGSIPVVGSRIRLDLNSLN